MRFKIVFSIWVNSWVSGLLGYELFCTETDNLPTQTPLLPSPRLPRLQCGAAFQRKVSRPLQGTERPLKPPKLQ